MTLDWMTVGQVMLGAALTAWVILCAIPKEPEGRQ